MSDIYTVSQINSHIKQLLDYDRHLYNVSISGEVSNCREYPSGHIYFTIKDAASQLSCVMFAGKKRTGLAFRLTEGMSVVVTGNISVYERDGKYQLYADNIEQNGQGLLYERFQRLKGRLEAEGLFDESHKKPIPSFVRKLGIVTSKSGAAVHDIINIATRRNPYIELIICDARVQGQGAAQSLINGLKRITALCPDVIIIGRGGGSFEDLFEFNDEMLARAIYDCPIPVISAVGHEVDFSISDFVSDLRAPTPSAAAELAVFEYSAFAASLADYHSALYSRMNDIILRNNNLIEHYRLKLKNLSPVNRLNNYRLRTDSAFEALSHKMHYRLSQTQNHLLICKEKLNRLSPYNKLSYGYSYISDINGHNIRSARDVQKDDTIFIRMSDGTVKASVTEIIISPNDSD